MVKPDDKKVWKNRSAFYCFDRRTDRHKVWGWLEDKIADLKKHKIDSITIDVKKREWDDRS